VPAALTWWRATSCLQSFNVEGFMISQAGAAEPAF
jgi:hypothetical protein